MKRLLISTALFILTLSAASTVAQAQKTREVILATRRDHRVVIFDARTLAELGHFIVSDAVESVSASVDGHTLFIEQPPPSEPHACCALFSLDLATGSLCQLIFPSSPAVTSPDGRLLFTQRGAVGVEMFDAKSFARLPVIKAPGNYGLHVSPDSRWLLGTTVWQGPSLDIFDIERGALVRRLRLEAGLLPQGAWLGDQFYLYAHDGKQGNIWRVAPDTTELGPPMKIALPIAAGDGKPVPQQAIAAGDRLIVHEPLGWWFKGDRRSEDQHVTGGAFVIDPASGSFVHLAPAIDFAQLVASADGSSLYGIDAGTYETRPPSLLRLNGKTGVVLKKRDLPRDVWHISVARVPEGLIPRGEAMTTACQNSNAGRSK